METFKPTFEDEKDYMMLEDMNLDDMVLEDMMLDEMLDNDSDNNLLRAAIGLDIPSRLTVKKWKATKLGLKDSGNCPPPSAKNRKLIDPIARPCKLPNQKAAVNQST